jgi:signal transduction histidine kinase
MTTADVLATLDPLVGVILLALGGLAWRSGRGRRVSLLMVLAGGCWFAGLLAGPALYLHRGPLVQLHLSYPSGRLRRPLAKLATTAAFLASVLEALSPRPRLTLAASALVAAAALDTFLRTSGPARRAAAPALAAALGFAGVLAVSGLNQILGWEVDGPVALGYDAVVCLAVTLLLVDLLNGRWVDATVTELVIQLGARPEITGLRRQLRRALGDPNLDVGLWIPGQGGYVDETGAPFDPTEGSTGRVITRIGGPEAPLAVLVHDPLVLEDPGLLDSVAAATRLAVANARMQADVEARTVELNANRRRIVEAADTQRRQLVEALGRGAEHRLSQVNRLLAQIDPDPQDDLGPMFAQLREETRSAGEELRQFAAGIRPPQLAAGGLAAALPTLASRVALPVDLTVTVGRLPAAVEAAAYFACSETLANVAKHSHASNVRLGAALDGPDLVVAVLDDGIGGADPSGSGLRGITDRIEALGGTVSIADRIPSGTSVVLRIPIPSNGGKEER